MDTTRRPGPGTPEDEIYTALMGRMSRAGLTVDLEGCTRLAYAIQAGGHKSPRSVQLARDLGLNPRWLPRRRNVIEYNGGVAW